MRKLKIATLVCAVGLATLGVVSQTPATATASGVGGTVTVRHCQVLRTLPGYSYTYQGARVTEPTGAARYRELVADGTGNLQAACRTQVSQQLDARGASAPTLTVLEELRY